MAKICTPAVTTSLLKPTMVFSIKQVLDDAEGERGESEHTGYGRMCDSKYETESE